MTAVGPKHFRAVFSNDTMGGNANQAQCGFGFNPGGAFDVDTAAAEVIMYVTQWLANNSSATSRLQNIYYRNTPASAEVPVAFPTTEVAAISADFPLASFPSAYGQSFGAGSPSGLGVGICVTEYSALAGRSRRGRHFLPYVAEASVDSGGQLIGTQASDNDNWASSMFIDAAFASVPAYNWSVWSPKLNTYTTIVRTQTRLAPSLLRSRRR
jgi:hypothetical protein